MNALNSVFCNTDGTMLVNTHIQADSVNIATSSLARDEELLERLPYAARATFDHYSRESDALCLPNTRRQVLADVMAWARGESSGAVGGTGPRIYWLDGMAGTGKSTIARTVARLCSDERRLGASFFFSRGGGELETARKLVTTIAVQLAHHSPALRKHISAAVAAHPTIAHKTLHDQWKQLVLSPFQALGAASDAQPCAAAAAPVVVIDALDECRDEREIAFVLQLLSETSSLAVVELKMFLTSRPEIPVRQGFQAIPAPRCRHLILHHIDQFVVNEDLRLFFEHNLGRLLQQYRRDVLQELVVKAGGLFIWAAITCRFVLGGGIIARKRLDTVLAGSSSGAVSSTERRLDEIYTGVLRNTLRGNFTAEEAEEVCDLLRSVLGSIVVLFSSLSASSLGSLLGLTTDEVLNILRDLHSIADVPDDPESPIRPKHASVRDYLLDRRRCTDIRFWINESAVHAQIASRCIQLMNDCLRRDLCNLRMPGAQIDDADQAVMARCLPPHLRYACQYWVPHVRQCHNPNEQIEPIYDFMRAHLLHWFEALSLLEKLDDGVEMLGELELMFGQGESPLQALTADAKRFLMCYRRIIQEAPLQVYASALAFAPSKSVVRRLFSHQRPSWLCQLPLTPEEWGPELSILEGHSHCVFKVAFSPNGLLLATCSGDNMVRLWNAKTGATCGALEGHTGIITAISFSQNSQLLASGSFDRKVRLWDVKTNTPCGTLKGHAGKVSTVSFSPDGRLLASGSDDDTVRLWSTQTGTSCGILRGHRGGVRAVDFSPDGQLLASGSRKTLVRLWKTKTGAPYGVQDDRTGSSSTVAFSPDGQLIASGSNDKTVRLWETTTGAQCCTLEGHTGCVLIVSFAPDGEILASGSTDKTVRLWDVKAGVACGTLEGHTHTVVTVSFSSNGQILASGSVDSTIRLWDAKTGALCRTLQGHSDGVMTVSFMPESLLLASGSGDKTVRLWEASASALCHALEDNTDEVMTLAFSPDGLLLASGAAGTVRLWNAKTGALRDNLDSVTGPVLSISFSPDSQFVAVGVSDRTVRLWNAKTGTPCGILEGHTAPVTVVAFSPDGHLLASGSDDTTIRLWDVKTGAPCGALRGHTDSVFAVSFSPNGGLLASASHDRTVELWDAKTGKPCGTFKAPLGHINAIAFSPDGQLLGYVTSQSSVFIFSLTPRKLLLIFTVGIPTERLTFSSDNKHFIAGDKVLPIFGTKPYADQEGSNRHFFLNVQNDWVTCNMRKLLWLPNEVRSRVIGWHEDAIAIGTRSGRILILSFGFRHGSPWA